MRLTLWRAGRSNQTPDETAADGPVCLTTENGDPLTPGRTTTQADMPPGTGGLIAMDWKDGRLVGIEILDATRHLHDDLLEAADTE